MCLIAFRFSPGESRYLLLAANRDEHHQRPARPMAWWEWPDGVLAGRDEQAGGTWLALARDGRWAAVTNVRDPRAAGGPRSRGELPLDFLKGSLSTRSWIHGVHERRAEYGPFNVLAGDRNSLWYGSSHAQPIEVVPGVHALSNGRLDEPWPKSRRVATALRGLGSTAQPKPDIERLFGLMDDRAAADEGELPDTGVGKELERFLSAPFIVGPDYGTRCTTVAILGERCVVAERSFAVGGSVLGQVAYGFDPDGRLRDFPRQSQPGASVHRGAG